MTSGFGSGPKPEADGERMEHPPHRYRLVPRVLFRKREEAIRDTAPVPRYEGMLCDDRHMSAAAETIHNLRRDAVLVHRMGFPRLAGYYLDDAEAAERWLAGAVRVRGSR